MAFYWSLTVTQFFDVKRKDFWQMFIHHMVTLLLMSLSWICNLHRVGSLVLVVHDCADIFLEVSNFFLTLHKGFGSIFKKSYKNLDLFCFQELNKLT